MMVAGRDEAAVVRRPAVAGSFYPSGQGRLAELVADLLDAWGPTSGGIAEGAPLGLLVPHAGLEYSGRVAAAAWRLLRPLGSAAAPLTVVLLGTNHGAAWLRGVAAWEAGSWRTPLGDVAVDADLAAAVVDLGSPFGIDREVHVGEHSIEVQLPLLQSIAPGARIVPLSVGVGTGPDAVEAGERLGALVAGRRGIGGSSPMLVISSDMAHYPPENDCAEATRRLLPAIERLDAEGLARAERDLVGDRIRGLVCGMCGIEPAVLGLAALRAMGATRGTPLVSATSADAGAPRDRTVGYLAVAFVVSLVGWGAAAHRGPLDASD